MTPRQPLALASNDAAARAGAKSVPPHDAAAGKMRRGSPMVTPASVRAVHPSAARALVCRNCAAQVPLRPQHACYECFGPLEVGYDAAALARVTRAQIEAGPANIWRYTPLLPVGHDPTSRVTLDPG